MRPDEFRIDLVNMRPDEFRIDLVNLKENIIETIELFDDLEQYNLVELKQITNRINTEFEETKLYINDNLKAIKPELRKLNTIKNGVFRSFFKVEPAPEFSKLGYNLYFLERNGFVLAGRFIYNPRTKAFRFSEYDQEREEFSRLTLYTGKAKGLYNIILEFFSQEDEEE